MLSRVSKLPLASKSLVDCWVSVPWLLFGWMEKDIWQCNRGDANEVIQPICTCTSNTTQKTLCYLMNLLEPYQQAYTYDTGNNRLKGLVKVGSLFDFVFGG
jgi:hypothetical protein